MKKYNLNYEDGKTLEINLQAKKKKLNYFKYLIRQFFLIVICLNVFIVVSGSPFSLYFSKNIGSSFVTPNDNFGKLKFVDNSNFDDYLLAETDSTVSFIFPFLVCKYDSVHDEFLSLGNNCVLCVLTGIVKEVKSQENNSILEIRCVGKLTVEYSGDFLCGVKINQRIKQGEYIGFSLNGKIKLKIYSNGELLLNGEIF